jgi:Na+:H+ antiporter, NhaA family
VLVIAVFYTAQIDWIALGGGLVSLLGLAILGRTGVRHPLPFILLGLLLWAGFLSSGVHATVAGVLLAFCIPFHGRVDPDRTIAWAARFAEAEQRTPNSGNTIEALAEGVSLGRSPLVAWEHALGPWVTFVIVPVFALANAGVVFDSGMLGALGDPVFWGVVCGLVIGKPLGVVVACLLVLRLGWAVLPAGLDRRQLLSLALLAGIGFTMAIFIAGLAFGEHSQALATAKAAILAASLTAGAVGFWLCRRGARAV